MFIISDDKANIVSSSTEAIELYNINEQFEQEETNPPDHKGAYIDDTAELSPSALTSTRGNGTSYADANEYHEEEENEEEEEKEKGGEEEKEEDTLDADSKSLTMSEFMDSLYIHVLDNSNGNKAAGNDQDIVKKTKTFRLRQLFKRLFGCCIRKNKES